jgi:predicted RNase H-like nuclease (RuvC/YqgF family)
MSDHTIDNLCPPHKQKVMELLKQINELSKRCGILESQIAIVNTEHQTQQNINSEMRQKIEMEELRLQEATHLSVSAHEQIQRLTTEFQRKDAEVGLLKIKVNESKREVSTLNTSYQELHMKYDKCYQDTGETFHPIIIEVESQTDQRLLRDCECQAPLPGTPTEVFLFDDVSDTQSLRGVTDELDDETDSLILMFNSFR